MKIFLDTGNVDEVRKAMDTGILDGVTTNPSLIAKEGKDFHAVISEIGKIAHNHGIKKFPTSAEVTATDTVGMVNQGLTLSKIHKGVVVKVPLTWEGIKAARILRSRKVNVNMTLCFSPSQALLAAKVGATYVSVFIGRRDDINDDGMEVVAKIREIFDNYEFTTKVCVASVRSPQQVSQAALVGADVITVPYAVFQKLLNHPLTDIGLKKFLEDWKNLESTRQTKQ
jgi:transaldolase